MIGSSQSDRESCKSQLGRINGHLIGLAEVGGLQTLFEAWMPSIPRRDHVINRATQPPLDRFVAANVRVGGRIFSMGYLPNVQWLRPPALRSLVTRITGQSANSRLKNYVQRHSIERLVLWNAPVTEGLKKTGCELVVYDHGLSWIGRRTDKSRVAMNSADAYIAVSSASKLMLQERWGVKKDIIVLPNPLRISESFISPRSSPSERITIGAAGRLVSFKGFASLLNATSVLKSRGLTCEILIAGTGPELANLKERTRKLDIVDNVKFLGLVENMDDFYSRLDIFVCPSLREPFGLVSVEATAYGVPTILSNVDGLPETVVVEGSAVVITPTVSIKDYVAMGGSSENMPDVVITPETGVISPPRALDPIAIADAVLEIVNNRAYYDSKALAASKLLIRDRSIESYATALSAILAK